MTKRLLRAAATLGLTLGLTVTLAGTPQAASGAPGRDLRTCGQGRRLDACLQ